MGFLRSVGWAVTGFGAAHVLESAWHRFTAHGKRPAPTRTGHLEHHRTASEPVDVWGEIRENAWRAGKTLLRTNLVLAPFIGLKRSIPLTLGLAWLLAAGGSFAGIRIHDRARTNATAPT